MAFNEPIVNTTTTIATTSMTDMNTKFSDDSLTRNFTLMDLFENETIDIGPRSDPLSTAIPMTILYAVILVTGVVGNISTCIVIARNKHMKTATNYYLFSLAISDLMLLILGLPQDLYMVWQKYPYAFGESFCIFRGLTSETSTNASVLTITAFTIERYLAICHPLRAHTMSKLSRVIRLIVIIWICATLGALPIAAQFGIKYEIINGKLLEETASCTVKRPISYSFEISTFIFFAIPITLICVLYMLIGIQLRRSEALNRNDQATTSSNESAQNGHASQMHEYSPQLPLTATKKKRVSIFTKNGSVYTKFRPRKSFRSQALSTSLRGSVNTSSRRAVIKMLSKCNFFIKIIF
ncbi:neuropeptides capa receptor-like protein [Dinothrombium tinctorium]|uniref:Neuropeptides capa receptor-like protein n=1 Tax=Dinothrombium tinctorium TaxID=1965070 RepID=A0A3S3PGZ8_9ACAR|nr:neuropeptides capa receptor-like protein [Dinothrombium tinctorium]